MKPTVLISASLAQRPGHGGHTWVFLQYVLGFKRLGWDVVFVDWLSPDMCRNAQGNPCGLDDSVNLRYFLEVMNRFGCPVFFDATHSGQRPGGQETGGQREFIPVLGRAAVAAGVDGLFIETHPDPAGARSDRESQWPLAELKTLLRSFIKIRQSIADERLVGARPS